MSNSIITDPTIDELAVKYMAAGKELDAQLALADKSEGTSPFKLLRNILKAQDSHLSRFLIREVPLATQIGDRVVVTSYSFDADGEFGIAWQAWGTIVAVDAGEIQVRIPGEALAGPTYPGRTVRARWQGTGYGWVDIETDVQLLSTNSSEDAK
jgi:hypothetical protein